MDTNVKSKFKNKLKNKNVLITGGSSGIGLSLAHLCVYLGANVTILARDPQKLNEAKSSLENEAEDEQNIFTVSASVFNIPEINREIEAIWHQMGSIDMFFNCAGKAVASTLDELNDKDIKEMIDLNLMGSIYTTRAIIRLIKEHNKKGAYLTLVGSQATLIGIYGYSVYSASKFALRGFAEALKMEIIPYEASLTLALPPDTDTPGFHEEEKTKPEITRIISETVALTKPEVVAEKILEDTLKRRFMSSIGFEGFMIETVCSGMSPYDNILQVFLQVALLPLFRLIGVFYIIYFYHQIKCYFKQEKEREKKK